MSLLTTKGQTTMNAKRTTRVPLEGVLKDDKAKTIAEKLAGVESEERSEEGKDETVDNTKVEPIIGKVEKLTGVAIPEGRNYTRESKYPWDELEIGESFFVPGAKGSTFHTLSATRNKKGGKRFIAKQYTHNDVVGVMVWRVPLKS